MNDRVSHDVTETHAMFLESLVRSQPAVWRLARWLGSRGHHVQVNPTPMAPTRHEAKKYSDNGDISLLQRIEVKHLSRDFTCAADWPFGWQKIIINSKYAFDNSFPVPHAYFSVSKSMTHAAIVRVSSRNRWEVLELNDKLTGAKKPYYLAPLDCAEFVCLGEE